MSLRYRILSHAVKKMGTKKLLSLPKDKLMSKAQQMNKKRGFQMPKDKKAYYTDELILEKHHCLKIQMEKQNSDKAILFLFGGGFLFGPDNGDLKVARDIGEKCNADIWFPYYPLCTEYSITESYRMVYEVYRKMVKQYDAENIRFIGVSSGAALAIGVCLHNNEQEEPLPMPKQIVACSPGCVPLTETELTEMKLLSDKDIILDLSFMDTIKSIMQHGQEVPTYMLSGSYGNFVKFPTTHFFYGSEEILYAAASHFESAYKKYNAKCIMHIGNGMCHGYPMVQLFPEGKQAYQEIVNLLSH